MTSNVKLLLGLAAGLALSACGTSHSGQGDPVDQHQGAVLSAQQRQRLRIAPVAPATFRPSVEVTGTVAFDGDRSTSQLCPISGPVSRILVEPGARVVVGQPLALVASPDYAAAIASYRKAEVAARNLGRIAEMNQKLYENDALSRRDLEQSQADAASAVADQEAALEQLRGLGIDSATIDDIRQHRPVPSAQGIIRAPITGTVVERLITPGQLLQAGATPCFTIAGLGTVWVMANVFEADLPYVTTGDSARVRLTDDSSRTYKGEVTYVGALVDPNTRATAVRILTVNSEESLKRDMYVRVTIQSRRTRSGLLVPASSVLRDAENLPFVFVAVGDTGFVRRGVQLGSHVGSQLEIKSGLTPGERVITEGGLFLQFAENQ
ncbi:MAG TPA: efflux RND transporter periplasmic adaptor subunit [Gemmatimonadales bacterium]|nr:efflux RND transporter periplasmic adaptor subunit [Gemmatimonadales bacterium]